MEREFGGRKLKFLVDTGSSKNYIKDLKIFPFEINVKSSILVKSVHAENFVKRKAPLKIFNKFTDFFILPCLTTFDGIIGYEHLKEIKAHIDTKNGILKYGDGQEKLSFFCCNEINYISVNLDSVPKSVRNKFLMVLDKFEGVFASPIETLPYNTTVVATIRTRDEEPIYSRYYQYPIAMIDFVNQEIQDLLANNIIRPSRSPYNNPIWVVEKKGLDENGKPKKRLVIDFRKLNSKTICDKYPIPETSAILANLGKAKFFTTLDLKSGFHQINLREEDREKTAFSINNGKYEFCRMPFGLKNAPGIFQRAIDDILLDEIGRCCHVYIDDIIIFSGSEQKHIDDIGRILEKLYNANMRVSVEKSRFLRTSVEFLGFTVSTSGIKTCPDKVSSIVNYPIPSSLCGLRSFLGLAGYYRRFVKDYAAIAKPLTKYLRGENGHIGARQSRNVEITLDSGALEAFSKLKKILASEEVLLLYPDFEKPFDLTTDASSHAIGAVLSQGGRPITMNLVHSRRKLRCK